MQGSSRKTVPQRLRRFVVDSLIHPMIKSFYISIARIVLRRRVIHIATGANSGHFYSMLQLINSIKNFEQTDFRISAYDLGLTDEERELFQKVNPEIRFIRFPYENYPPHFDITKGAGEYAWKPCIVYDEYQNLQNGDFLIWLDGGNFVKRKMWLIRAALFFNGFYTRLTTGTIGEWTVEQTMQRLGMASARHHRMICGCFVGVRKGGKNDLLVREWRDGAVDKGIIAPDGSSRKNHRQDQSVVSLLYYKYYPSKRVPPLLSRLEHELLIHQDIG